MMHRHPPQLSFVLFILALLLAAASGQFIPSPEAPSPPGAPFNVKRTSQEILPRHLLDGGRELPKLDQGPAFKASTSYQYQVSLTVSSHASDFSSDLADPASEFLNATVGGVLTVKTWPLDQSPEANTLIFQATLNITHHQDPLPDCNVPAIPAGLDQLIHVTQDLKSGEFDLAAFPKLIDSYVVSRPNRMGSLRNETYTYIGTLVGTDDPCYSISAESMQGDEWESYAKATCYSNNNGGVSLSGTFDHARIGTDKAPNLLPIASVTISDRITILSETNEVDMYWGSNHMPSPALGAVTDIGARYVSSYVSAGNEAVDVSKNDEGYVKFRPQCVKLSDEPNDKRTDTIVSAAVPSPDKVTHGQAITQLQPIGVRWPMPHLATVSDECQFLWSFNDRSLAIDASGGYGDWQVIDLGSNVVSQCYSPGR
ncbi:hypothetical protein B0T24DRAFT_591193 [Lasiosphaeria ovina]|uniref:Uncharacterized protein n=1 Tax=Lasiosphaeria ovina TaxID=92902 RepID=A0AAE0TVA5_9PEZI|nr:hypothetical protein B0T24DRAFT_591193 [Lasiosphaeria ovina]